MYVILNHPLSNVRTYLVKRIYNIILTADCYMKLVSALLTLILKHTYISNYFWSTKTAATTILLAIEGLSGELIGLSWREI
jgi:hypothetical protein